jgi:Transposase DDE domain
LPGRSATAALFVIRSACLKKTNYVNKLACDACTIRARCTNGKFRAVSRLEIEAVLDWMQARLKVRPGVLDRRRESVEHPFGTIKQWMHQGAFLMRGPDKVRG